MPLLSRSARLLGGLSAVAAGLLAGAAPASAAVSLDVTAQCSYPVGGVQPASFTITFPDDLQTGDWAPVAVVSNFESAGAEALGDEVRFDRSGGQVNLEVTGAAPISGHHGSPPPTGTFGAAVWLGGTLPDLPDAFGSTFFHPTAGPVSVTVTDLHLNLRATRNGGGVVLYPTPDDPDHNPETADVPCTLDAGQDLTASYLVAPRTAPLDAAAPSQPGPVTVTDRTLTSATINWGAATDDVKVDRYLVFLRKTNGTDAGSQATTGLSATFRSLQPGTDYIVEVQAVDRGPAIGPAATATFTTQAPPSDQPFFLGLSGSAAIKQGRQTGTLPLAGTLEGTVYASDSSVSAGLTLNPSTAEFRPQGALRITAKATYTSVDGTSGSLSPSGVFQTQSKVAVAFSEARLFGTVPIATGASCGLKDPAIITLTSAPGFDPGLGGALTGTAELGRLSNCGTFGQLVGPDLGTAAVSVAVAPPSS